jgi:hypothetical protein
MELSDATEKAPATPGIDPGTFRLVAQCLNHYATPGPVTERIRRKTWRMGWAEAETACLICFNYKGTNDEV